MINEYKIKREQTRKELMNIMKLGYKIFYIDDNKNIFIYKDEGLRK